MILNNKNIILLIVAVCALLGAVAGWRFSRSDPTDPAPEKTLMPSGSDNETATTTKPVTPAATTSVSAGRPIYGNDIGIKFDDNETITPSIAVPSLSRVPSVAAGITPFAKEKALLAIAGLQKKLQGNSKDFMSWVELGLQFSSVGDYEGARDADEYACALRPGNSVAFGNLGFVYAYHLKDVAKAEVAYLTAIKNDPSQEYIQIQLFEVYRDIMADKGKAKAFAESRIKANPEFALDFTQLIAELDRR